VAESDVTMDKGFLAICGISIVCLSVLVGIGKDGAITNSLLGAVALLFGANTWQLIKK